MSIDIKDLTPGWYWVATKDGSQLGVTKLTDAGTYLIMDVPHSSSVDSVENFLGTFEARVPEPAQHHEAVFALVSAVYFHGFEGVPRGWANALWGALKALDPEIYELCTNDPKAAWDITAYRHDPNLIEAEYEDVEPTTRLDLLMDDSE